MGFMSRRVLPVCGSFCVCCPALRSRSRQPVKRYKKLIADVFPRSQDELPNDRKISKLCDYASKNPLRVPKIAESLEQKGYKALRHDHLGSLRVVMAVYTKLFSACKSQMPLFASSALSMLKILLDQTRRDEVQILGCEALVEFAYNQVDGTYIHHFDGLLSNLCSLAEETGEVERRKVLRSAGLKALSALIWFMGENSHMPSDYDHVVRVIIENYGHDKYGYADEGKDGAYQYWVKEVEKSEGRTPVIISDSFPMLSFRKDAFNSKESFGVGNPSIWARACIEKIALAAKEATTRRRLVEPILHYFDTGRHWESDQDLALSVLQQIVQCSEKSGIDCYLIGILVKHLDHKSIKNQPQMKAAVVKIVASLTQDSKTESTIVEINVLNDIFRHLCSTLQASTGAVAYEDLEQNKGLQSAIQDCLLKLVRKLGDFGLICEMMALTLEKLSQSTTSKSTMSALLILADIVASLSNLARKQQNFSEALLHQLSLAMVHPDSDIRVDAHGVFRLIMKHLSSQTDVIADSGDLIKTTKKSFRKTVSALHVANVLIGPLVKEHDISSQLNTSLSGRFDQTNGNKSHRTLLGKHGSKIDRQAYAWDEASKPDVRNTSIIDEKHEMATIILSSDQAAVLLSAMWTEANMDNNSPRNYEAMFKTFSMILIFSSGKNLSHAVFVRAVQLALSLRTLALSKDAHLSPSMQRSIFVLSASMLMFALNSQNIPGITAQIKGPLTRGQVDPFLEVDDEGVRATKLDTKLYGSASSNASASESLASVRMESISNDSLVSLILSNLSTSFEAELSDLRDELLQTFSPDEGFTFGLDMMRMKGPWNSTVYEKTMTFNEVVEPKNDLISDISGTDLPHILSKTPIFTPPGNIIGVSQLLESALETAGQVASATAAPFSMPYSAVAMRCEAFGANTRRNMPVWVNLDGNHQTLALKPAKDSEFSKANLSSTKENYMDIDALKGTAGFPFNAANDFKHALHLPPVSHYDNFLRAAGC
ncbi:hypothetical protein KP509_09G063300 [Ceratopteris richardii]|uniref:ARM repeat superfamily protein n=4 Tax=Ceratopteris richardii TaxID=49495 RepID=A0A8T2U377_CERRI|nr:hypothetical protein KP509_09G063300 [Ceratopteris richardii]